MNTQNKCDNCIKQYTCPLKSMFAGLKNIDCPSFKSVDFIINIHPGKVILFPADHLNLFYNSKN